MLYVPVGIIPYPVIWLYDKILWLSDPVLLVIEVVLALNFVMHCSRRAAENIEEDEEEAWKWKVLLLNKILNTIFLRLLDGRFSLPKQSQKSRSILQNGSRSLALFW